MINWVSISESLPKKDETVFIHIAADEDGSPDNLLAVAWIFEFNSINGQPSWSTGFERIYPPRVTHWRKLTFLSPDGKEY